LNILLRDKGLEEEELVPWEDEILEFNCCVCATTVVVSITLFNVPVTIIIATINSMAVANANRFIME
jgi:hypothetical protein